MNVADEGLALDALAGESTSAGAPGSEQDTSETDYDLGEGAGDDEGDDDVDAGDEESDEGGEPGKDDEDAGEGDEDQPPKEEREKETGSQRWKRRALAAEARVEGSRRAALALTSEEGRAAEVEKRLGPPPKQKDGEDWVDFETRKTAYELDRRAVTREVNRDAERALDDAAAEMDQRREDFRERRAAAAKVIPDFDKVMSERAPSVQISDEVKLEILDSEKGPLLAYHLAKNPGIAAKLNALPPRALSREIGRLEATLKLPTPQATRAQPPVRSPRGSAPASSPERDLANWLKRKYG